MRFAPSAWPRPLRLAILAAASAVLLVLTLAPSHDLPRELLWDKAEHALAWATLTAVGLLIAPRRPRAIVAYAILFGALVEGLQWALPFGRDGDVRDLLADSVGVAAAVLLALGVRRLRRRRPA